MQPNIGWKCLIINLAQVLEKAISTDPQINQPNRGIKFILQLDSVPGSMIRDNQGIKYGLNLIHLVRSINLISEQICQNKQNGITNCW